MAVPSNLTLTQIVTEALKRSGLDACLTKKLAHMACMKALNEAVGKVTQ